jgi:hypothetical protein
MLAVIGRHIRKEQRILFRVLPFIALLVVIKIALHELNLELLSINSIFSGLIGANVFLMGLLLSGVLSDFRETDFISSGYFIASTATTLLLVGLAFARIEPFYESLFFVIVVSYLLLFLMFLIHDLDNPFGYYENTSSEDVSLKPLNDALDDLGVRVALAHQRNATHQAEPA